MENGYEIGYELVSKQVRAYRTNDVNSVRRALSSNIQEYLVHEGVKEDEPHTFKNVFQCGVAISLGVAIFFMRVVLNNSILLTTLCIGLYTSIIAVTFVNDSIQQSRNTIFLGTGVIEQKEDTKKTFLKKLEGRHLHVLLDTANAPKIKIEAQIIDKPTLFVKHLVFTKDVERTMQYGKYFGSTGFFYPPAMVKDIDSIIAELTKRKIIRYVQTMS
ncbi:hypothetical protein STCU_02228 [Strigomonas culicis]|uniref:Signal peptidase complex subunit 2 n=1 Tax=Strigomonas culicis TaxID=28005 RepID=S9UX17_9TRYP|nr:hypothetical protein STCU_02228 [Strigomonas culicis]|eukprot:EPY33418.1 hypothetical protein STCU_02228 [Strigomonas culicis]